VDDLVGGGQEGGKTGEETRKPDCISMQRRNGDRSY